MPLDSDISIPPDVTLPERTTYLISPRTTKMPLKRQEWTTGNEETTHHLGTAGSGQGDVVITDVFVWW